MGYCKVKKIADGKVKIFHQLDSGGKAYAEDVTVESDVPGRIDYLEALDGKVGTFSFGFTPASGDTSSIKFPPEAD